MAEWKGYNNRYHVNYKKRILESYKLMDKDNLNYKVVKIQVPYDDRKVGSMGTLPPTLLDKPLYAVDRSTKEKTNGTNKGTCYDDSIAYALLNFKQMNAEPTTCYIKATIPLYNMLKEENLILE